MTFFFETFGCFLVCCLIWQLRIVTSEGHVTGCIITLLCMMVYEFLRLQSEWSHDIYGTIDWLIKTCSPELTTHDQIPLLVLATLLLNCIYFLLCCALLGLTQSLNFTPFFSSICIPNFLFPLLLLMCLCMSHQLIYNPATNCVKQAFYWG